MSVLLYFFKRKAVSKLRTALSRQRLKQVIYVDSKQQCECIINKHFLHHQVLGLDCEWVTIGSHRGPVSLLQIASPEGVCALFRMPKLYQYDFLTQTHSIPQSLERLLDDSGIIKVGVAIENDSKYLAEDYNVLMSSWLDLRHLAVDNGVLPRGLAYLAQETVGIVLQKKFNVRVSNWDADDLSEEQIHYAAMDAHAAMSIFTHFVALKQNLLRLLLPLNVHTYKLYIESHHINSLTGVPFKDKQHLHNSQPNQSSISSRRNYCTLGPNRILESTRSRPDDAPWRGFRPGKMYDNCYLLDPQNRVLCTCERKKAQWYLDKNLGVQVKQDPLTVRLSFQPQVFDREDCKYYAGEKRNQCVVCGNVDIAALVKKYIVPHEYRKYMPDYMKDRRSHDVLLMCYRCHKKSNVKDQMLRKALASECNAPLDSKSENKPVKLDFEEFDRVKTAARNLSTYYLSQDIDEAIFFVNQLKLPEDQMTVGKFYHNRPGFEGWPFDELVKHASSELDYSNTNVDTRKVRSAALALKRHALTGQLPENRFKELKRIVHSYYNWGGHLYRDWDLETRVSHASQLRDTHESPDLPSHGELVVVNYMLSNRLEQLETRWRQHFVNTMRPRYLPDHWSLYHNNYEIRRKKALASASGGNHCGCRSSGSLSQANSSTNL